MTTTDTIAATHQAAVHAQRQLADQIERALRSFAERLRQRREWIRTRDEIATLDAATLRDIGLHRSEADSVAAELHGLAGATRRRVLESRVDPRPT
jgi:uncharacterized protein YjiS (DUF1127 family)